MRSIVEFYYYVKLLKKVPLGIAINDEFVDSVVESITKVARKDGDKGRVKIFIIPIEECIRIRTSETGTNVIG